MYTYIEGGIEFTITYRLQAISYAVTHCLQAIRYAELTVESQASRPY